MARMRTQPIISRPTRRCVMARAASEALEAPDAASQGLRVQVPGGRRQDEDARSAGGGGHAAQGDAQGDGRRQRGGAGAGGVRDHHAAGRRPAERLASLRRGPDRQGRAARPHGRQPAPAAAEGRPRLQGARSTRRRLEALGGDLRPRSGARDCGERPPPFSTPMSSTPATTAQRSDVSRRSAALFRARSDARQTRTSGWPALARESRPGPRPGRGHCARATTSWTSATVEHAVVSGYEGLIPMLTLPDPDDRHALTAAIHGGASVIVTANLKDFPA